MGEKPCLDVRVYALIVAVVALPSCVQVLLHVLRAGLEGVALQSRRGTQRLQATLPESGGELIFIEVQTDDDDA